MEDVIGSQFGYLTVESIGPHVKGYRSLWCVCVCGTRKLILRQAVLAGAAKSCGCMSVALQLEKRIKHGRSNTPLYKAWHAMKSRCCNPNNRAYSYYGARGITVCERWFRFENFVADMGERPDGMTLDRIDNDGDYCPENCRWATRQQQQRNRRANRVLEVGDQAKSVTEWAEEAGLDRSALASRLNRGWSSERAVMEPQHSQGTKRKE